MWTVGIGVYVFIFCLHIMEKVRLTKEQAKEALEDWDSIHTFRNPWWMLMWADRSRENIIELIDKSGEKRIEIWGKWCRWMWHWMIVRTSETEPLFVSAKEDVLAKYDIETTQDQTETQ